MFTKVTTSVSVNWWNYHNDERIEVQYKIITPFNWATLNVSIQCGTVQYAWFIEAGKKLVPTEMEYYNPECTVKVTPSYNKTQYPHLTPDEIDPFVTIINTG